MAWSEAARAAALEARKRRHGTGMVMGLGGGLAPRAEFAKLLKQEHNRLRSIGQKPKGRSLLAKYNAQGEVTQKWKQSTPEGRKAAAKEARAAMRSKKYGATNPGHGRYGY